MDLNICHTSNKGAGKSLVNSIWDEMKCRVIMVTKSHKKLGGDN
jgi:hypothetical protein